MKLQSMLFIAATTFSTVGLYSGEKAETAVLPSEAVVMTAGELWHPFQFFRQVEKNSALDFSSNLDAPAGKYGRVIAGRNGRLVFQNNPERPVRFFGANLAFNAQFPENKSDAEELAERFSRMGFNLVRIHHHDDRMSARPGSRTRFDSDAVDRLNYLISCFRKRGIYYTTDGYVSRQVYPELRLPEPGRIVSPDEYKALIYINDEVFRDFIDWTIDFLSRTNPYTGLALKDDPALITFSLVNEGNPMAVWKKTPRTRKLYQAEFKKYLRTHPKATMSSFFNKLASRRYLESKSELRARGIDIPLSDQNFYCVPHLSAPRMLYDYVDVHLYWDHPRFAGKAWQLPLTPHQKHPIPEPLQLYGLAGATRIFGKPFSISEFNYCKPNIYRACGPLLMGSYGAFQGWDILIPFSYAHTLKAVFDPGYMTNFFDIATDPIQHFSQRIAAAIFLSGGVAPAEKCFPAVVTNSFLQKGNSFPQKYLDLVHVAAIGTVGNFPSPVPADCWIDIGRGHPRLNDGVPVIGIEDAARQLIESQLLPRGCIDAAGESFASPGGQLFLNRKLQTFRLTTPEAEALVCAPGTALKGVSLAACDADDFTVLALLPRDGVPLAKSRRMVLFMLTDCRTTGMRFSNSRLVRMEAWGKTPFLLRRGRVEVTLRPAAGNWNLHALDSAGRRLAKRSFKLSREGAISLQLCNVEQGKAVFAWELIAE